ncbi:uncharacterized protein LOC143444920 [Clavelina lepadiformis]|uniref:uncharacterized protein LOC143444920 n=1 Tax=Clavelina lepadiformis TaxID=159417 RepID=UPI004041BA04
MDIGDQDNSWAPHVICGSCRSNLEGWLRGSGKVMSFVVPRVWREPQNHHDDCYFCMINISKYCKISGRRAMAYPSTPSSIAPVPHSEALPIPNPPSNIEMYSGEDSATASENADTDAQYAPTTSSPPHFPTKKELDDLIRYLGLTKSGAELLTSRLNE